jgi:4-diphosphocytidyl-2-C-methyl-D-erythritol kinase
VTAAAPAKINLTLRVGGRRADGFHPLNTLFHAVDLDEQIVVRDLTDGPDQLEVVGPQSDVVPLDGSNLVLRAAQLLRQEAASAAVRALPPGPVHCLIRKAIPVAGGLAGGSADAAAALIALNQLWSLGLDHGRLVHLAGQLGSDVPFALLGANAVGTGRGEELTAVTANRPLHWVLLTSPVGLSTPAVFQQFDSQPGSPPPDASPPRISPALLAGLRSGDPWLIGANLVNDLEAAAFALRPDLARTAAAARAAGACGVIVSGSGPTIACLAPDQAGADALAAKLAAGSAPGLVRRATGPAPGARLCPVY